MKKITLLMLTLICSVVGMAQSVKITKVGDATTTPESGKVYAIECNSQAGYTTWMLDNGKALTATQDAIAEDAIVSTGYFWKLTPTATEGVYTVQNVSTGKYISVDGTGNGGGVSLSATETTVIITLDDNATYFAMKHMTADQWIDMSYSGTAPSTWSGGVAGSRRMQIHEVEYAAVGEMAVALSELESTFKEYLNDHVPSAAQENVGTECGNYGSEVVAAYVEAMETASSIIDAAGGDLSIEEIQKAKQDIIDTWDAVIASRVPYAQAVKPGYYVIKNALDFTTSGTAKPESCPECDGKKIIQNEDGSYECDECGATVEATTVTNHIEKAIYADKTAAKWKTYEPKADFLFKVTETTTPLSYIITNQLTGQAFATLSTFADTGVGMAFDLSKKELDIWEGGKHVAPVYNIRLTSAAERDYNYVHAGGHSSGAGVSGSIVNWNHEDASVNASDWYLEEIDEATALAWIEASSPGKRVQAMIDSVATIKTAFPAQKAIAVDETATINEEKQVANAETFLSPWTESQEGSVEALFDESAGTFWHSVWSTNGSTTGVAKNQTPGTNYFVINDVDDALVGGLAIRITRRAVGDDHPTQFQVYGTNDYDLSQDTGAGYEGLEWTELGTLNTPYGSNTETVTSNALAYEGGYKYYKFVCTNCAGSTYGCRGYFHMSELRVYPATVSYGATTTQATVRAKEIAAVEEAIAAWNAAAYTVENVSDPENAEFVAAYNKVVEAYAAWTKVYADPAAMRQAANTATDFAKGMVEGKNPGQWPVGAGASVVNKAVEAEQAYNNAGAYTPEGVAAQVKAINDAKAQVAGSANQIQEGKWYAIRFATEEEYEANGWDKSGAESTTEGNLYGNYVAPATVEAGEPKTQPVVDIVEIRKGQQLRFTEMADAKDAVAAFRFVKADDSHYLMQHVSGWYVGSNGQLGNTPALFSSTAIGYGKSLIKTQNLKGEDIDNGGTPSYLHAQVANHALVSWAATAIDSRSALYIEEVDAQTIASSTKEALPEGTIKFLTSPVEMEYDGDVQLYNFAGYEKTDKGVKVAFDKTDKAEAGKAVLMVVGGEYYPKDQTFVTLDVTLGTQYATVPDSTQALVGTYQYQWVEEANCPNTITIFENKMQMATGEDATDCSRDISAYTGAINLLKAEAIATDGKDLVLEIEGEFDVTAIQEVVAKAINTNGNIYTIDGKYVGKGNMATARKFGAGLYIINGVKVAIK